LRSASADVRRLFHLPLLFFLSSLTLPAFACREKEAAPRLLVVAVDLSGPGREQGRAIRDGARLALRQMRAADALCGLDLRLLVEDDGGDAERAAELARELVDVGEVIAVIGPSTPTTVAAALPVYSGKSGLPVLVPGPLPMEGTEAGPKWVFSVAPGPTFLGESLAWFLVTELRTDSASAFVVRGPYAEAFETGFSRELQRLGGGIDRKVALDSTLARLDLLARATREAPALLVVGRAGQLARIVAALRSEGVDVPVLASEEPADSAPEMHDLTYYPMLFDPRGHGSAREFTASFSHRFGYAPDAAAALAYDAASLVVAGCQAGARDRAALRRWLVAVGETAPHAGVTGTLFFSRGRQAVRDIPIASHGQAARVATRRTP
jgi:ABC-type branched-subunit amino acid transport system substrate-binding protein